MLVFGSAFFLDLKPTSYRKNTVRAGAKHKFARPVLHIVLMPLWVWLWIRLLTVFKRRCRKVSFRKDGFVCQGIIKLGPIFGGEIKLCKSMVHFEGFAQNIVHCFPLIDLNSVYFCDSNFQKGSCFVLHHMIQLDPPFGQFSPSQRDHQQNCLRGIRGVFFDLLGLALQFV